MNPAAGKSKELSGIERNIRQVCSARMLDYHIYFTTEPSDATEYVKSMMNISVQPQRFICCGGDGTLSECINGAPDNPKAEFGVIPYGSGNDFARNFTNEGNFYDIEAQLDGNRITIDLIKCNDYYCVNMINIGFDCNVVKEALRFRESKNISPKSAYMIGVFKALFKKYGTNMKIIFDNGEIKQDTLLLTAIANGRYCGGGFNAAPRANIDDGYMDLSMIKKISRFRFLTLLSSYRKGTHVYKPSCEKLLDYRHLRHFRMEFDEEIDICIDGELKRAKDLDFSIVRNTLNFIPPKGCFLKHTDEERIISEAYSGV